MVVDDVIALGGGGVGVMFGAAVEDDIYRECEDAYGGYGEHVPKRCGVLLLGFVRLWALMVFGLGSHFEFLSYLTWM